MTGGSSGGEGFEAAATKENGKKKREKEKGVSKRKGEGF